jgi:betaine lipid synthase
MLSPSLQAFSPSSPTSPRRKAYFTRSDSSYSSSPKESVLTIHQPESTGPLSSFYYQRHNYRMPYFHGQDQKQFWSWIYAFTWEDPKDDMRRMKIGPKDTVMCITSAGDNALHYAIEGKPKRIHCVDSRSFAFCQMLNGILTYLCTSAVNPCQGHLLELKLAAVNALEYDKFWQLFGEGRHPSFKALLDEKLAPHLSAHAYAFWRTNSTAFDNCFYKKGYSGCVPVLMMLISDLS